MNATTADEVERLKAAESAAEQRHAEAMRCGDLVAARSAAEDWVKACDALTAYVTANPYLYRDRG